MRPVSLRQIEAFKAVYEQRTVSAASEVLHVSQPALSRMIRHLEADSGLQLFDRVRNRLVPTARAVQLYEEVDRIFLGLNQVQRSIESIRRAETDTLRVGTLPALSGRMIQAVTAAFLAAYPEARLSLIVRETQTLTGWVSSGQADIVIIAESGEQSGRAADFMQREAVAVLPVGHPLAGEPMLTPRILSGWPMVQLSEESRTRRCVEAAFAEAGADLNMVVEVTTLPTVCSLVAAGIGIAVMHPLAVTGPGLVCRPFSPIISNGFVVQSSPSLRNRSLVSAFMGVLQTTVAKLLSDGARDQA